LSDHYFSALPPFNHALQPCLERVNVVIVLNKPLKKQAIERHKHQKTIPVERKQKILPNIDKNYHRKVISLQAVLKNENFCLGTRQAKIITAGIKIIF